MPFATPNRAEVQVLPFNDSRVTCLHDDVRTILDSVTSLDIALRNRDYVSQAVSENEAHVTLAQVKALLRSLAGL